MGDPRMPMSLATRLCMLRWLCVAGAGAMISGCGTVSEAVSTGLEKLGLKQPTTVAEAKAMVPISKEVALRIHAGDLLNLDAAARPLSMVIRIYRLKAVEAFNQAPLAAFKDGDTEKAAFGNDLVAVREVVLTPRQKYEVVESVGPDVKYVAVVGLFRAPSIGRWRFAFDKDSAAKTGILLGAHACAFSVAAGDAIGAPPELTRLTGVRCS